MQIDPSSEKGRTLDKLASTYMEKVLDVIHSEDSLSYKNSLLVAINKIYDNTVAAAGFNFVDADLQPVATMEQGPPKADVESDKALMAENDALHLKHSINNSNRPVKHLHKSGNLRMSPKESPSWWCLWIFCIT